MTKSYVEQPRCRGVRRGRVARMNMDERMNDVAYGDHAILRAHAGMVLLLILNSLLMRFINRLCCSRSDECVERFYNDFGRGPRRNLFSN